MTRWERKELKVIVARLMLSDNLGDVHEEIDRLHDLLDLPRPEGSFVPAHPWTVADFDRLDA